MPVAAPVRAVVLEYLPRLFGGDDLLGFGGLLAAQLVLIPVGRPIVIDDHIRLHRDRSLIGFRIDHGDGDFCHAERFALARSGENHVLHAAAAQAFGALLAQHPAHAVEDVRLSAPIRPHDHRNACPRHGQFRTVAEALEAEDVDFFQFQHALSGSIAG